jgi:hypothetical protein
MKATTRALGQEVVRRLYDEDFFAWTQEAAERLRAGRLGEIDTEHVATEIEDMGKRDFVETKSRLRVLLTHLLKWRFQRAKRSRSWEATIFTQREEIAALLDESPSLRPRVAAALPATYGAAVRLAALETGLARRTFPKTCPFTLEQVLDAEFLPQ